MAHNVSQTHNIKILREVLKFVGFCKVTELQYKYFTSEKLKLDYKRFQCTHKHAGILQLRLTAVFCKMVIANSKQLRTEFCPKLLLAQDEVLMQRTATKQVHPTFAPPAVSMVI
jgi:hypothetical protein